MESKTEQTITHINSLYVAGSDYCEIRAVIGEDAVVLENRETIEANVGNIWAIAQTGEAAAFVYQFSENVAPDHWKSYSVPPTSVIRKDHNQVAFWTLSAPEEANRVLNVAYSLGMPDFEEPVPVAHTDGWVLVHIDESATTTPDALLVMLGCESEVEMYGDARVVTNFDHNAECLDRPITVSVGASREAVNWKPTTMPLRSFVAQLCTHRVGKKDGPSLVLGDMVPGRRLKTSVKSIHAIGLDNDNGTASAAIDEALKALGCMAIRYTTNSHGDTRTEIKQDVLHKFAEGGDIDIALIKRYLKERKVWDQSIINSVKFEGVEHVTQGLVVVLSHMPMPKNRIIVPLLVPFEIAKQGRTQQEAMANWTKVPEGFANLIQVPFDKTGTDPSRLFHLPRHNDGEEFETSLFGGPLFDWRTLELFDPYAELVEQLEKPKSKSRTEAGRKLGKWAKERAHGFQIVDVLEAHCPDKIRGAASHRGRTIECPFDAEHSNAGDDKDTGCFAVNAGDGPTEWFTVACQHGCCKGRTNLDHTGKMIEDGWFEEKVLRDEQFNAVVLEQGDALEQSEPQLKGIVRNFSPTPGLKASGKLKKSKSVAHAMAFIEKLNLDLAYNELEQRAVLRTRTVQWHQDVGHVLNDDVTRMIRHLLIVQAHMEFSKDAIFEACLTLARHNSFNPAVDYLNGQKWDGKERIDEWLIEYAGADDSDYARAVGRKILIAAVRRAKQPGVKFDNMPILEGPQGSGKSSLVRILGGEFYSDAELGQLDKKDAPQLLQGVWIYEVGELAVMYRSNDLKAFVTRTEDRFREPYERFPRSHPRTCVFFGTTNDDGYLSDPTGNRRYWPIKTGKIDLKALSRDRDQLWAEAVVAEATGEALHLPEELWAAAAEQQSARVEDDPWKDVILAWLESEARLSVLTKDILLQALELDPQMQQKSHSARVRKIMRSLGWDHKKAIRVGDSVFAGYVRKSKKES